VLGRIPIVLSCLAIGAGPVFPASPKEPPKAKSSKSSPKRPPTEAAPAPAPSLAVALEGPDTGPQALVGWMLRDADKDSLLEGREAERNFTPGSTQKLFTTWLALETLGPDRTYATDLRRRGEVKQGVLDGDLVMVGCGDPGFAGLSLGEAHGRDRIFADWLAAVRRAGIAKVTGCVLGDGSFLAEEGPHPASLWEDAGNYYAGNVSGLCFNDNLYALTFDGAPSAGRTVSLKGSAPRHTGIARFDNRLLTGPKGGRDSAYILGGFPSPVRLLRGTYPAGRMPFTIKGSLPNPAWTAAREFRDHLAANGIEVATPIGRVCGDSLDLPNVPPVDVKTTSLLATHASAPVKEMVRHVNQKSDNNYASQLLALCGKASGRPGDWRGGLLALDERLDRNGFDGTQIHFRDGNGLSRYNWVSPAQTARLLILARKGPHREAWLASLVGAPGSTKKLERYGSGWSGRLLVKTGTLEGVASLAGYLRADSGRWLAFAVSTNNYATRGGPDGAVDPQRAFIPLLRRWAARY
jgi:D-alanyl-D-alanine carboxypeptidase/D-alanyl-D-alanine-endopeptidase (penicillin-binding protein 4)